MLSRIKASPPIGHVILTGALGEIERAEVRRVPIVVEGVLLEIDAAFSRRSSSKLLSVTDLAEAGFTTTFSGNTVEIIYTGHACALCRT
jgi:hypothetical protein